MTSGFNSTKGYPAALLIVTLFAAAALLAQNAPNGAQSSHAATPLPATDEPAKKAIKDHAEYDAYAAAVKINDPAQRAAALEQFAQVFPRSVAVGQALTEALAAWQQAGKPDQVVDTAKRLLVAQPANIRAMAIVVALDRAQAEKSGKVDAGLMNEICEFSNSGLKQLPIWQMPSSMSAEQFSAMRNSMTLIFNAGAETRALGQNDLAKARETLARAVAIDSTDLQSLWQLSVADIESRPVDANGFWYCARAIAIAQRGQNQAAAETAIAFCNKEYMAYHGSPDGWNSIMVAAQSQDVLPADFPKLITPSQNPNSMNTPTEPVQNLLPQPAASDSAQPAAPASPQP